MPERALSKTRGTDPRESYDLTSRPRRVENVSWAVKSSIDHPIRPVAHLAVELVLGGAISSAVP